MHDSSSQRGTWACARSAVLGLLAALALLVVLALSGCSSSDEDGGDGCTGPDCGCVPTLPNADYQSEPYDTVIEEFDLLSPHGDRIYGMLRHPDPGAHPNLCFAAVIMIPGGINPGRLLARGYEAQLLAGAGMVVATFNAEGRGDDSGNDIASEGAEDCNGHRNQDTLREILLYVMDLDYVIAENVGIKTQSFGIAMGAGCLGRYPELPVKYLIDGEGPPNSFVTAQEA
jgi:hypothetical protein